MDNYDNGGAVYPGHMPVVIKEAISQGYESEACTNCGAFKVKHRSGTLFCDNCQMSYPSVILPPSEAVTWVGELTLGRAEQAAFIMLLDERALGLLEIGLGCVGSFWTGAQVWMYTFGADRVTIIRYAYAFIFVCRSESILKASLEELGLCLKKVSISHQVGPLKHRNGLWTAAKKG